MSKDYIHLPLRRHARESGLVAPAQISRKMRFVPTALTLPNALAAAKCGTCETFSSGGGVKLGDGGSGLPVPGANAVCI